MRHARALRALLCLPCLLAFAQPADDLTFHPKDGSEIKKKLAVEIEFKPEDIEVSMGGEPLPAESVGDMDDSLVVELAVLVTEKFVQSKDGRPIDLLRTFDELALSMNAGSESEEAPDFDRLEGKTVRFHWKDEGETYERSFHESEGDDVLLLNLSDDMDLRALLPERNVAEGDTWEVPGSKLLPLFLPGGLPGEVATDAEAAPLRAALEEVQGEFEQLVKDGKLTCKYAGPRDEGDTRVAVIGFTLQSKGEVDLSDALETLAQEEEVAPSIDATARIDLTGEGQVLWDLAAGRVHAFEMRLESKLDLDVKATADVEGEPFEFAVTGKIAGTGTWNLTTSAP